MGTAKMFGIIVSCLLIGTAASACTKGDKSPVDEACDRYMECGDDGQLVQKTCSIGKRFDPVKKECAWRWSVKCYEKPKECEAGRVYPNPTSCRLYYSCTGGKLSLQLCPLAKVFDPSTGQCKYGWGCKNVECTASQSRMVVGDCSAYDLCLDGTWARRFCGPGYHFDPVSQECKEGPCTQCKEGELRKGGACNRYQECDRGVWAENKCFWAKRFDPVKKQCVWFFQYSCPKSADLRLLAQTCNDGETRAEEDCTKYSVCDKGSWSLQSCPDGYMFDSVKLECLKSNVAKCMTCSEDMADEKSCGSYYGCEQGKKVPKSCGFMKNWDGISKKCVLWGAHCFPGDKCTEEGIKVRAEGDCKQYKVCRSGNYYKESCGMSRFFDSKKQKCVWVWPWKKCDSIFLIPECSEGETKLLNCDQYVECVDGKWNHKVCKVGETFRNGKCIEGECTVIKKSCRDYTINGVDLECVEGEVFDQTSRQCLTGSCDRSRRSLDSCKEGETQRIDCKKYRICVDGTFVEKTCLNCTNFNNVTGLCNFVWDYPCKDKEPTQSPTDPTTQPTTQPSTPPRPTDPTAQPTTQPSTPPTPTQPSTPPTSSTQAPTPSPACKEGENIPDYDDCRKYSVCKNGRLVPDHCWWPRKFDSIELTCKWWGAICAKK